MVAPRASFLSLVGALLLATVLTLPAAAQNATLELTEGGRRVLSRSPLGRGRLPAVESQDIVRVSVNPTNIQPVFRISGYEAKLPVRINVAPPLSWRLPINTGLFHYENARGAQRLRLSPSQMSLIKRNGYLEVQADVALW